MNLATEQNAGQVAYEAYCAQTGWKSLVSGQQLPQWHNLKPEIQSAWQAAATAVVQLHHARIGEIRQSALELCWEIERLPASPRQTCISLKAASVGAKLNELLP